MTFIRKLMFTVLAITPLISVSSFAARVDIHNSADNTQPLLNGQSVPNVSVFDVDGKPVNLAELVKSKPTIIFFYRGGWCPYCNMQMGQLQKSQERLKNMGYQLIGISPDSPAELKKSIKERELSYTLLSDGGLNAMRGFGIAFYLSDEVASRYRQKIDADFVTDGKSDRIVLPAPAAYVFDTNGIIQFQYVNPNYKARVEPAVLELAAKLALK